MSRLSTLLLLSTIGCKVAVAPVNDTYFAGDEVQGRTDLGVRTTFTADTLLDAVSIGHHPIVQQDAFDEPTVTWVETVANGICDRRVRTFTEDYQGFTPAGGYLYECDEPGDESFAFDLHRDHRLFLAGSTVLSGARSIQDPAMRERIASPDRSVASWGTDDRITTAIGLPGAREVLIAASTDIPDDWQWMDLPLQTVQAPVWLAETVAFGTSVHLLRHDLLIVGDATGRFHFHERVEIDDGETWVPVDGPAIDAIHAVHEDELLVEREGFLDLEVLRYTPADGWSTEHVLRGAAGGYTQWVMDEVAAFAVEPRDGRRRGVLDRWSLQTGDLDASLSLVRPHDGVEVALAEHTLVVSELGSAGAVHVFDWSESRQRLFGETGELVHGVCQIPVSASLEAIDLASHDVDPDDGRHLYRVMGDAGDATYDLAEGDDDVWYVLRVGKDDHLDIRLSNPLDDTASPPNLELHVDGEVLVLERQGEPEGGVHRYEWYNFSEASQTVLLRLDHAYGQGRPCTAFQMDVERDDRPFFCDDWEWGGDPRDLLDISGDDESVSPIDLQDRYTVDLAVGATLQLQLEGDVEAWLVDAAGNQVDRYWPSSWRDYGMEYVNEEGATGPFELIVDRHGPYGPGWSATWEACTPYTLHASVLEPAADDEAEVE